MEYHPEHNQEKTAPEETAAEFEIQNELETRRELEKRRRFEKIFEDLRLAYLEETRRDSLTGAYNRKGLEEGFLAMKARLARKDEERREGQIPCLTLMLLDVDNFKAINDTHGHLEGDAALKILVEKLSESIREGDIIARYGGEEFVLLFPGATKEEVLLRFGKDDSKDKPASFSFNIENEKEKVFSVSVSGAVTEYDSEEDFEKCVGRADKGLYFAKRNGKNMIIDEEELEDRSTNEEAA